MRKLVPLALILLAACNSPSSATRGRAPTTTTVVTLGPPIAVAVTTTTTLPLTAKAGGKAVDVEQLSGSWRVVAGGAKPFADFDVVTFLSTGRYLVKASTGGTWTLVSDTQMDVKPSIGAAISYTVIFEEGHLRLVGPAGQDMILTRV